MDLRLQSRINNYKSKNYSGLNCLGNNVNLKDSVKVEGRHKDALIIEKGNSNVSSRMISNSILDALNFENHNIRSNENKYYISGTEFTDAQIPDIPLSRLNEIKAVNNVISFENGKYYKFTDSSGNVHKMTCSYNLLTPPYSDNIKGEADKESLKRGQFWNILSENATFIRLYYTDEEEKQYLNEAGITEGFFTVKVGKDTQEYFYSNGNSGRSVLKSAYDAKYEVIKNAGRFFDKYDPGSVFKIDGKEYKLSESHTLDIPYGADIYNIEYPPRN